MQRAKKRKLNQPRGTCYEDAGRVVAFERDGLLVHGTVWSGFFGKRIDHAWVVLAPGTVIEDGTGEMVTLDEYAVLDLTLKKRMRLLPKPLYDALAQTQVVRQYTPEETSVQILKWSHWGPWPTEEGA